MFRQPEEWLMAVLAVIWVGVHYFLAGWATAASVKYTLMITFFHALLTLLAFLLWQRDKVQHILPLPLAGLVYVARHRACGRRQRASAAPPLVCPVVVQTAAGARSHCGRLCLAMETRPQTQNARLNLTGQATVS